jgi:carboxylesterase type B
MYPAVDGDNRATASDLIADATFVCSARYVAAAFAKEKQGFLYHFALKAIDGLTVHASELPYVFDDNNGTAFLPAAGRMAVGMGEYWSNLAVAGGAAGPGKGWPAYSDADDTNIVFDKLDAASDTFATEAHRRKKFCDFWLTGPIPT